MPHFRRVFLTAHVSFSYMSGINLLNSTSPEHSYQTFVLKEDERFGVHCTQKHRRNHKLSSNREVKEEERTGLKAYLEMTGRAARKACRFMKDSN